MGNYIHYMRVALNFSYYFATPKHSLLKIFISLRAACMVSLLRRYIYKTGTFHMTTFIEYTFHSFTSIIDICYVSMSLFTAKIYFLSIPPAGDIYLFSFFSPATSGPSSSSGLDLQDSPPPLVPMFYLMPCLHFSQERLSSSVVLPQRKRWPNFK